MCGIAGYISKREKYSKELHDALNAISHRGPDNLSSDYHHFDNGGFNTELGHVRLSIIDLTTTANQPYSDNDNLYSLVFNGEIYNYKELREELIAAGDNFQTSSDTEVLFKGLIRYGKSWIPKLDGMFAFVFIDRKRSSAIISRDLLGIKPLYYQLDEENSEFFFCSEIRGLKKIGPKKINPDTAQIGEFLLNGFLYEPDTGLTNCKKVFPGSVVTISFSENNFSVISEKFIPSTNLTYQKDWRKFFKNEINRQLVADVPVGVFFSGGIDSSVIMALVPKEISGMHVLMTNVSDGENDTKQDTLYARKISNQLGSKVIEIQEQTKAQAPEDLIDECVHGIEELISDFTYIPTKLVSKVAAENGYKVMLSGMGADELFGGYPRYFLVKLSESKFIKRIISIASFFAIGNSFKRKIHRLKEFLNQPNFDLAYTNLIGYFSVEEVKSMLIPNFDRTAYLQKLGKLTCKSGVERAMELDRYGFLAHNLIVTDKASMQHSMEVRVPFLSNACVQVSSEISKNLLIKGFKGKLPLRTAITGLIDSSYINRKKVGFNPPMKKLIDDLDGKVKDIILKETSSIIHKEFVENLIREHYSGYRDNTYRIWQLLYLARWIKWHQN